MIRKCYESGKHDGEVKRRRVLRYNGQLTRELHSGALCDRHYRLGLKQAVKRGAVAAELLER
jgi:hypothetical protein